jgi:cellulose biosynthesis protein BcsQ
MPLFLAVANRKGGVGKSTVAVTLAHAFSTWGEKRVLVLDLDSQCNASLILLGGEKWSEARNAQRTIADYIKDQCNGAHIAPPSFLIPNAGDVLSGTGKIPQLSVLPGSILLDDIQGDLFLSEAGRGESVEALLVRLRSKLGSLLRRFEADFDVVILDCAPGLSMATVASIGIADKVIVPFRPDYVSQLAVDRVALLVEEKKNLDELAAVPFGERRYICLANFVGTSPRERLIVEEISIVHPLLNAHLSYRQDLAAAFDWLDHRLSFEAKFRDAVPDIRAVYSEVSRFTAA